MDNNYKLITLYDECTGEYYTVRVENEDRAYEVENEYYN